MQTIKRKSSRKIVLCTCLLFVAAIIVYCYRETQLPGPTSNPISVMPSPNARDTFNVAEALMKDSDLVSFAINTPHGPPPSGLTTDPLGGWHTFTLAEKDHLVAENLPALAEMKSALNRKYMNPQLPTQNVQIKNHLNDYAFADIIILQAQVRKAHGDWEGAMESCIDTMRFGCDLEHGSSINDEWVGVGCEDKGRREIRTDSIIDHLSASELRTATGNLYLINSNETPVYQTIQEDEWASQAQFRMSVSEGVWIDFVQAFSDSKAPFDNAGKMPPYLKLTEYFPRRTYDLYTKYTNALISNVQLPWPKQNTLSPAIPRDVICELYAYVYRQCRHGRTTTFALSRLLDLQLAIRAYYLDHGTHPTNLDQLVPAYVTAVPLDPFSDNQPFKYHLSGNSYILYSIGPDGVDDGGKPLENTGSIRKWLIPRRNYITHS